LIIYKLRNGNEWVLVHQTEVVMNTLNPEWQPFELTIEQLCDGETSNQLKIECFDWDKVGAPVSDQLFSVLLIWICRI
jgi:Ca2+-dependent lipid-binding protein